MSINELEELSADDMLEVLRQHQVETLQEENRRLKEENIELHRQIDVVDVIMSDSETREIIDSIKRTGSLDYESPTYELETLDIQLHRLMRATDSLDGEPVDDELFKQVEACARLLVSVQSRLKRYAEMLNTIADRL